MFTEEPSFYLDLGWEKVADVVLAMNDVWRKDLGRRGALGNLARRRQTAEGVPQPHESHKAMRIAQGHHLILTDDGDDRFHLKEVAHANRPATAPAQSS